MQLGHDVVLGTRDPKKLDEKKKFAGSLNDWLASTGNQGRVGTFQDAAAHGELLINATEGQISVDALKLAAADKVGAKVLIDTGNELDFGKGMPPGSLASQGNCLGEKTSGGLPQSARRQVPEHDDRAADGQPEGGWRR